MAVSCCISLERHLYRTRNDLSLTMPQIFSITIFNHHFRKGCGLNLLESLVVRSHITFCVEQHAVWIRGLYSGADVLSPGVVVRSRIVPPHVSLLTRRISLTGSVCYHGPCRLGRSVCVCVCFREAMLLWWGEFIQFIQLYSGCYSTSWLGIHQINWWIKHRPVSPPRGHSGHFTFDYYNITQSIILHFLLLY